jgi:lysozyme family protein/peptidoglycan hydrolase-like protein with peptidoglycan-binding domain
LPAPSLNAGLKSDYQLLFDSCLIRPDKLAVVNSTASQLASYKGRYQTVAQGVGTIPWYFVGLVHALEAGFNFNAQLHNGDPLTARTVHVPAGRPTTGSPPFTWEESATDALTYQGLNKVTDWSLPGILYRLEAYNGFGYRSLKAPIPSPYLWSFSNHYTSGKYTADGTYSPTAVSAQCGAAVLLKRLTQIGQSGVAPAPAVPRTLAPANPHMTGPDVADAQNLLNGNPFGNFGAGTADGDYGDITAGATRAAKYALGYPDAQVNGVFGPLLASYLEGTKPLPPAFAALAKKRAAAAPNETAIRQAIVQWANWGVQNTDKIAYSQNGPRLAAINTPGQLPLVTDCSGFATLCYAWAKAPNPNASGPYDPNGAAYTGTMLTHMRHIPPTAVEPGDLIVWTPPSTGAHVVLVVQPGADPVVVSHGDDTGPKKLNFSAEDAYHRQHGSGTAVYLTAF